MGEGKIASGSRVAESDGWLAFVGGSTAWESARGGWGRSRVADDGVGRRPWCLVRLGSIGGCTGVIAGLTADGRADMSGRGGHGVKKFGVAGSGLALSTPPKVAAPSNEESEHHDGKD